MSFLDIPMPPMPSMPSMPPMPPMPKTNPLQWQLTISSDDEYHSSDIDTTAYQQTITDTETQSLSECSEVSKTDEMPEQSVNYVLNCFGDHNNYKTCNDAIVNGYVRQLQSETEWIIPSDINEICFGFFYDEEHKHMHLAYTLYKHTMSQSIKDFNGKQLVSMVKDVYLKQTELEMQNVNDHINAMCHKLLKHNVIEFRAFQTSFLSFCLEINTQFYDSEKYVYQFTPEMIQLFEKITAKN